jgi:hypothetical protein
MINTEATSKLRLAAFIATLSLWASACAPRIIQMDPSEGRPGTIVSLSMEYLVGWPRVEISGQKMDYYELRLLGLKPERTNVSDMELAWIEDKVLQFRVPELPPGEYLVTVHDDKGPPGDKLYSALETTAYLIFPPVWPFVLRSNEISLTFRITAE